MQIKDAIHNTSRNKNNNNLSENPCFLSFAFRIALLFMLLCHSGWWEQSDLSLNQFQTGIYDWLFFFKHLWSSEYNCCTSLHRLHVGPCQDFSLVLLASLFYLGHSTRYRFSGSIWMASDTPRVLCVCFFRTSVTNVMGRICFLLRSDLCSALRLYRPCAQETSVSLFLLIGSWSVGTKGSWLLFLAQV